jgi:hypothetical protein
MHMSPNTGDTWLLFLGIGFVLVLLRTVFRPTRPVQIIYVPAEAPPNRRSGCMPVIGGVILAFILLMMLR